MAEEKKPLEKPAKPASSPVEPSALTKVVGKAGVKDRADKKSDFGLDVEEMMKRGCHFGHRASRVHPKMKPYISGLKNTIHLIDLEKTVEKFKEALEFIRGFVAEGKVILFVGTKTQVKEMTKELAEAGGLPYVIERWLGGTFTNFSVLRKRIDYFKDLQERRASGALNTYTKKEIAKIDQELQRLKIKFEGLKNLSGLPEAIFVLDMKKDALAVKEARMKGVKVIAITDTNVDPTLADYPIPANDDAISSVKYILDKVKEVILKAKSKL